MGEAVNESQVWLPPAPELAHPDWIFGDGRGAGCVRVLPVACLTWGTRVMRFDFESTLFLTLAAELRFWWRRHVDHDFDERWRVVVSRCRRRYFSTWRALAVEFFDDEAAAEARQVEILRDWSTEHWSAMPPLDRLERRRLRLATRTQA